MRGVWLLFWVPGAAPRGRRAAQQSSCLALSLWLLQQVVVVQARHQARNTRVEMGAVQVRVPSVGRDKVRVREGEVVTTFVRREAVVQKVAAGGMVQVCCCCAFGATLAAFDSVWLRVGGSTGAERDDDGIPTLERPDLPEPARSGPYEELRADHDAEDSQAESQGTPALIKRLCRVLQDVLTRQCQSIFSGDAWLVEELDGEDPKREDVRLVRVRLPHPHLRRHVAQAAGHPCELPAMQVFS